MFLHTSVPTANLFRAVVACARGIHEASEDNKLSTLTRNFASQQDLIVVVLFY